ncbi:alpha-amylase family glycosyl hydrolase [Lactobacillus delbrueckii subsp. bulgaricus]
MSETTRQRATSKGSRRIWTGSRTWERTSFGFCRSSRQARRSGREPGFQPYAISDYRAINPEYGTMEDFKRLCDDVYAKGDEDHHRLRLQPHFPRLSPG